MPEPSPSSLYEPSAPQAGHSAPARLCHRCPLVLLCFSMPAPGDREVTRQGSIPRACWALWGAERPLPPPKTFPYRPKPPEWQQKPRTGARRRCLPAASSCTVTPRAVPALSPLPGRARGGQGGDLQALPGAGGTQSRARRRRGGGGRPSVLHPTLCLTAKRRRLPPAAARPHLPALPRPLPVAVTGGARVTPSGRPTDCRAGSRGRPEPSPSRGPAPIAPRGSGAPGASSPRTAPAPPLWGGSCGGSLCRASPPSWQRVSS